MDTNDLPSLHHPQDSQLIVQMVQTNKTLKEYAPSEFPYATAILIKRAGDHRSEN
jgi:hypothetical protein